MQNLNSEVIDNEGEENIFSVVSVPIDENDADSDCIDEMRVDLHLFKKKFFPEQSLITKFFKDLLYQAVLSDGLLSIIFSYKDSDDINVLFENIIKYILENSEQENNYLAVKCVDLGLFMRIVYLRQCSDSTNSLSKQVGEVALNKCGMFFMLVYYKNLNNINVLFDNGFLGYNKTYHRFKYGNLQPRNNLSNKELKEKYIGMEMTTVYGLKIKCIDYINSSNIIVEFEDGFRRSTDLYYFLNGHVSKRNKIVKNLDKESRIGLKNRNNSGELMTIVGYRGANDIDIEFEDGTILTERQFSSFKSGEVSKIHKSELKDIRIGEKRKSKCGLMMEIINYKSHRNIDVRFEDGTIVKGKRYSDFCIGEIRNPNFHNTRKRIGEYSFTNSGVGMKIIEYFSKDNITVKFSDGLILKNTCYYAFRTGNIKHPTLRLWRTKGRSGVSKGSIFSSFDILSFAYRLQDKKYVFYICQCRNCGYRDILTPTEMLEHKCEGVTLNADTSM